MRRRTAAIVASGCAALVLGVALSFSATRADKPSTLPVASTPAVPVVAAAVKSGDVPIYLHGIGTVDAWNTVVVRSQIQGPLIRIAFKEGQMVHKGDLLAEIDPRPYQAQLDQAIANRDRDRANLQNDEIDLKRCAMLLPNQLTVSQQQYDTQNATVAQLKASVKADEAAIETARIDLSYTRLTSPTDGVTGIYQIDVGNIIHPTDTDGLVTVTQIQPIAVIFTLPEADLPEIRQQVAKGPMTVLAYNQDNKTFARPGQAAARQQRNQPDDRHTSAQGGLSKQAEPAVARPTGQRAAAARNPAARVDRPRARRAAGPERRLCLCHRAQWNGRDPSRHGRADRQSAGGHRFGAEGG